jgi:hypothetical protein
MARGDAGRGKAQTSSCDKESRVENLYLPASERGKPKNVRNFREWALVLLAESLGIEQAYREISPVLP